MKKYLVVFEKTRTGYSAFSPDLPGCVATGKTKPAALRSIRSAIGVHLEGMRNCGLRIPHPRSSSTYIEVKAA